MRVPEKTKEEIVEIALGQFLNNGIQSFTIKNLTLLTGVSTKTVYKFFGNKQGLLSDSLYLHYSGLFDKLCLLMEGKENEVEVLWSFSRYLAKVEFDINPQFYYDLNKFHPDLQNHALEGMLSKLMGKLQDIIAQGKQNGFFLSALNQEVFWITFKQIYSGITRDKIYQSLGLSGHELFKDSIFIYIRGICTPKGVQKLLSLERL